MVGRDAELEQLREAFKALCRERKLVAVTVVAEAGVGKSRLALRVRELGRDPTRDISRSSRVGPLRRRIAQPYGVAARHPRLAAADRRQRQHWRREAEDRAGHCASVRSRRWRRHGRGPMRICWATSSAWTSATASTSGHPGRRASRSATAASTRPRRCSAESLRAARASPDRAALLDDLHWADDGSLDFLTLPLPGQPRRADAGARPDSADAVRAVVPTGMAARAFTSASTSARSTRARAACSPTSC